MYLPPFSVSPIFIQLIPFFAFVKYASIGLGEPPLAMLHILPNFSHAQDSGISNGISSSMQTTLPSANFS